MGAWCSHKVHSAYIANRVVPMHVPACRWGPQPTGDRGQVDASHHPGVSTVGLLFIFCDLALVGAKVQTQRQIGRLVPHSEPRLRDARHSDSQPRGQSEGWAVGMPLIHHTVLYKCRGPMSITAVNEVVLTLLTIWRREQQGLGKV